MADFRALCRRLEYDEDFEVSVVANGRSVVAAADQLGQACCTAEENLGFGRAINLVAGSLGRHDWLLLVNDDLELSNSPGRIRAAIENTSSIGPDVGLLYLQSEEIKNFPGLRSVMGNVSLVSQTRRRMSRSRSGDTRSPVVVDDGYLSFACVAIRSDLWLATGGFDSRFPFTYEDADFARRARDLGYFSAVTPVAGVEHRHSVTTSLRIEDVFPVTVWSARKYCEKWGAPLLPGRALLLVALFARLFLAPFTRAATVSHYRAILRAALSLLRDREPALPAFDNS